MKKLLLSLVILLSLGTSALLAQNQDTNKTIPALKIKLTDANLTVDSEALVQNTEFVELLLGTESMDKIEKQKLAELDKNYSAEKKQMQIRHAKELIEKIYELLHSKDAGKLTAQELDLGLGAIMDYEEQSSTYDNAVLAKATFIIDASLKEPSRTIQDKAFLHSLAYKMYGYMKDKSKLKEKMYHLSQSIELVKSLKDDANAVYLSDSLANLSYLQLCDKQYENALKSADEALSLSKEFEIVAGVNKAHALVFLGRTEEAKAEYLKALNPKMRDEVIEAIKGDAKELTELGHPKDKVAVILAVLDGLLAKR